MRGDKAELAKRRASGSRAKRRRGLNQPQKAKPIIEAALAIAVKQAPGSKLHADILKSQAGIAAIAGDPQGALEMLHQAHAIYGKLGEARAQAIALQQMGSIYSQARDYPRVLEYYEQANEIFSGDPALTLSSHNNRGNAYKDMGEFAKAEQEFAEALKIAREMHSPLLEVRILTNLAEAQALQGRLAQAMRRPPLAWRRPRAGPPSGDPTSGASAPRWPMRGATPRARCASSSAPSTGGPRVVHHVVPRVPRDGAAHLRVARPLP
jgi:tetratricopeptide (TPR) repeat protein